jgi:hypothetical protein
MTESTEQYEQGWRAAMAEARQELANALRLHAVDTGEVDAVP